MTRRKPNVDGWSEYWKDIFYERVAIMMFQANMTPDQAEIAALEDCERQRKAFSWNQYCGPVMGYQDED